MSTGTKYYHPTFDASKMLEAALQQMDGIIAGTQMDLASLPDRSLSPTVSVHQLCEKLKSVICHTDDGELEDVDAETRRLLMDWLSEGQQKCESTTYSDRLPVNGDYKYSMEEGSRNNHSSYLEPRRFNLRLSPNRLLYNPKSHNHSDQEVQNYVEGRLDIHFKDKRKDRVSREKKCLSPHINGNGTKQDDSEDLSDSGATSEESLQSRRRLRRENKGSESDRSSLLNGGCGNNGHHQRSSSDTLCLDRTQSFAIDPNMDMCHRRSRPPIAPRPGSLGGYEEVLGRRRYRSPVTCNYRRRDTSVDRLSHRGSCESIDRGSSYRHHNEYDRIDFVPYNPCCCNCSVDIEPSCERRNSAHRHSYHEDLHRIHLENLSRENLEYKNNYPTYQPEAPSNCCRRCFSVEPYVDKYQAAHRSNGASHPYPEAKVGLDSANSHPVESDYIPLWACYSPMKVEERLAQVEADKESLHLQVSVLSEQVDAQTEKIKDLEASLDHNKALLSKSEDLRQKELLHRSTLETQRLELLSELSHLRLRQAALERENAELLERINAHTESSIDKSQVFKPEAASTPYQCFQNDAPADYRKFENSSQFSSLPGSVFQPGSCSDNHSSGVLTVSQLMQRNYMSTSLKNVLLPRTPPPNARRKIDQFGTIPRHQRELLSNVQLQPSPATMGKPVRSPGVQFAETEKYENDNINSYIPPEFPNRVVRRTGDSCAPPPLKPLSAPSKTSSIKKIFTKLRRTSSGHLENGVGESGDLKRGGLRATATARLGWASQTKLFDEPTIPFGSWSSSHVERWFSQIGLSQYSAAVRCWMLNAENHISKATPHQLEKEIGLRHPLHRKKVQLAITNRMSDDNPMNNSAAKLDCAWVLRWLDDLSLPQYKDVFSESRVDGLLLNYLSYDDLSFLKISSLLHVMSLKRGIQVLREHNFDASVLKRRSAPEDKSRGSGPAEVIVWTNHRVMEWLKTVDLSEYAPNLRGSGVHGALMVYEVQFTAEFLASLLSIPNSKTLLRRHLSTHFKDLVGKDVVQVKRDATATPGYIPLTTTAKIKLGGKSQFSLKRRKTKLEVDLDDLLCPFQDVSSSSSQTTLNGTE